MFDVPVLDESVGLSSDVCVITAAKSYNVPPDLMLAVRSVERGVTGQSVGNTNGTRDHGEPGLNTETLQELDKRGWDTKRISYDGCYGMYAASYWMRTKLLEAKYKNQPLLSRAARYNSATPEHNQKYQARLAPFLQAWGCYLHVFWRIPAKGLFVIASGVLDEEDLSSCKTE